MTRNDPWKVPCSSSAAEFLITNSAQIESRAQFFPLLSMIQVPENDLQTAQGDDDDKCLKHKSSPPSWKGRDDRST